MLAFKNITEKDYDVLYHYYQNCTYRLCEYSLGTNLMWNEYLHPQYAEAAGCLIIKAIIHDVVQFEYPVAAENGDINEALCAIEQYCQETEIRPVFYVVPESCAAAIAFRWPRVEITNERGWKDYIYNARDLMNFEGRHYSGQRNHINKFHKNYPDAKFVVLGREDIPRIEEFFDCFEREFEKDSDMARNELGYAREMLSAIGHEAFRTGGLEINGKLISFGLAERSGETLIMHIEKAMYSYEGVYPTMVQEFTSAFAGDCCYVNREDDARDKGLRTSKMQYRPVQLDGKVYIRVGSELDMLKEIPTIETERLTLAPMRDQDAKPYYELCTNEQRNLYWGYDYKKDLHEALTEDYFLQVARHDWQLRYAVNFAILLDQQFIGEVVLYNCDWHGGMELGCRIDERYAGNHYGTEAFACIAEWALYQLGLEKVVARCYKQNIGSYHMLSKCMNKASEDETFCYFEKKV